MDERAAIECLSGDLSRRHRLVTAVSLQRFRAHKHSRYRFRHHLFQQFFYHQIDAVYRAHMHEAAGTALEALNREAHDGSGVPALRLAWHFDLAGLAERAAAYYLQAGNQAVLLCANEEAITLLARGLALLDSLPETPERIRLKLNFCLALVTPFNMARGFQAPERIHALERASQLSNHPALIDSPDRRKVLLAMAYYAFLSAQFGKAVAHSEQILCLAGRCEDEADVQLAHSMLGAALVMAGRLAEARDHLELALAHDDRRIHDQPNLALGIHIDVLSLGLQATALWLLGYPEQATRRLAEAEAVARESRYSSTMAFTLSIASLLFDVFGA